jgi:hypothetical protein
MNAASRVAVLDEVEGIPDEYLHMNGTSTG